MVMEMEMKKRAVPPHILEISTEKRVAQPHLMNVMAMMMAMMMVMAIVMEFGEVDTSKGYLIG